MVYKNIKKRTFEIIQASTEHDLASKIFDICLIVLVNRKESESCLENLTKWANQGVLMLNTVLTVRAHQANSHRGIGWEEFTDAAIMALNGQDRPIVFILWGAPAQRKKAMLNNPKHLILTAPHPSPLSAYRGFFGSRPFSKTNEFLESQGEEPIDWQIE